MFDRERDDGKRAVTASDELFAYSLLCVEEIQFPVRKDLANPFGALLDPDIFLDDQSVVQSVFVWNTVGIEQEPEHEKEKCLKSEPVGIEQSGCQGRQGRRMRSLFVP